jgi:hypothetical protein
MWRYFSACVETEKVRHDDIVNLGESILSRCVRALQARDAIGEQFYVPQNNNTRDSMMYHFDYLTLVLAGAFDAQARVAYRAYKINRPTERNASFRNASSQGREFIQALKCCGANDLHDLVSEQRFQALMTLIYELRNTIHGAGLHTCAYESSEQPQVSFISVPDEYADKLWRAVEQCDSPEKWGFRRMHKLLFEPYTYSVVLVEESLKLIDAVATATDVGGLFPEGYAIRRLIDAPPEDRTFSSNIRKRLAVLG